MNEFAYENLHIIITGHDDDHPLLEQMSSDNDELNCFGISKMTMSSIIDSMNLSIVWLGSQQPNGSWFSFSFELVAERSACSNRRKTAPDWQHLGLSPAAEKLPAGA